MSYIRGFFHDKIINLKRSVASTLLTLHNITTFPDPLYFGSKFNSITPVTADEVLKIINAIPPKSSPVDFIPTSVIKRFPVVFAEIITNLTNLSFSEGKFPSLFKTASITPLLKKHNLDKNCPSNYRPISNLNNISKIVERLFLCRFQPHVTTSPNFNQLQSAYRPFHSTETSLLYTLNNIYTSADAGKPTVLVSLDLSAAFDTIDHSKLLSRLSTSFGLSGSALAWLKSYLSDRTQSVRIAQSHSPLKPCSSGVPQGSVLGPLLFSLYISPIGNLISDHGVLHQQYADDTQLYISLSSSQPFYPLSKLECCLSALHSWFCVNGLCLNPSKSDAILFGTWQRLRSFPVIDNISIAGTPVPLSDHVTTLGIILDSHLSLAKHVSSVCKSSYFHIRALRHIRPALTLDSAKTIAVALVQSRLDYANSILFGTSLSNLSKLQRLQNSLSRIVLQNYSLPPDSRLHLLHWLPVRHRIDFKIATLTYRVLNFSEPSYLASLLSPHIIRRTLRSNQLELLHIPFTSTNFGSRAFMIAAPTVWNNIPLHIRQSSSLDSFKRQLKSHLFSSNPT